MAKNNENGKVPDFTQETVHGKVSDITKGVSYDELFDWIAWCFALQNESMTKQISGLHEHLRHLQWIIDIGHDDISSKIDGKGGTKQVELGFWIVYDSDNSVIYKNGEPIHLDDTQEGTLMEVLLDNTWVDNTTEFIINELKEHDLDLKEKLKSSKRENVVQILLDIWWNASRWKFAFLFESGQMTKKTDPELLFRCDI